MEELYDIKDLTGYQITKTGKVWSTKSNKFLKQNACNGYDQVTFKVSGKSVTFTVPRLVAETFIPNPENKPYVNHINNDRTDNRVENLEWVTQKENCENHGKKTSHPRKVIQKDLEGNIIKTYDSLKEAGIGIGKSESSISKAVLKINQTAGGFVWDYEGIHTLKLDITQGKAIYGNNKYLVFPNGNIYNNVRKALIKPIQNAAGYCYVTISSNKTKKNCYIHRLVAEHFIENKDIKKTQVNHKNKKRDDNTIENLEWVTPSENLLHAKLSVLSLEEKSEDV